MKGIVAFYIFVIHSSTKSSTFQITLFASYGKSPITITNFNSSYFSIRITYMRRRHACFFNWIETLIRIDESRGKKAMS